MQDKSSANAGDTGPVTVTRTTGLKSPEAEIDILALLDKYLFPYWKRYCIYGMIFAVIFAAVSFLVTPQYEASLRAQVQMGSEVNPTLLKARMSGLGSMMGLSQMATGDAEFLYNMNFITSRDLADAFMMKYDFRHQFFEDDYDEAGNYEKPEKLTRLYRKILGADYQKDVDEDILLTPGPSKMAMFKTFRKIFEINMDSKGMTVTVSVRWKDPLKAKQWANDYLSSANNILRAKTISECNRKIKYLESQIKERPEIEVQNSIYSLIEEQLKKISMAEASDQYAFKVIERAFLPERRVSPNRYLFLFAGAFFGCLVALASVLYPGALRMLRKK